MTIHTLKPKSSPLTAMCRLLPRAPRATLLTLLALAGLTATPNVPAAPRTWSGGGGDSIVFQGITRVTNYNNLAGLNLTGISFNNSDFLFGGTLITNSGGIYDNSGNNTNNLATYLSGSQGITNAAAGTVLQLGGIQTNMATGNILTFGGPGNIYVAGVVSGLASINANGDGSGNGLLRLSAANTFTGPLAINSGTLQLGNASAIPSGAGKGDVTNNATLDMNGNSQTINSLFGNSSGTVDNKTGTGTYTLTVGNNATNQGGWFEFDGTFVNTSGSLALTKVNTNVFYLNGGSDTYAGNTTVSAGKLILGANATIANTPVITVAPGAQLDISQQTTLALGSSQSLYAGRNTNGGPGDILGSVDNSGKMIILNPAVAGTLTITNNLTLESGSTVTFDLGPTNTAGMGSNDLVVLNGTLGLNGGTIALNPYTGSLATGANGIYTLITNAQALETGSAANLTVAVPRGVTATLNDTSFPGSLLVAITGSGVPVSLVWDGTSGANWDVQATQDWLNNGNPDYFYFLDNVVFNDVGNPNVNVATGVSPSSTAFNNSATNAYVLSGPGSISGSGTLTINNGGTVTLNIFNDYTGDTIVNYGNLLLGNYLTGGNNIVVYNGVAPGNLILGNGGAYSIGIANQQEYTTFNSLILKPGGSTISFRNRQSNDLPWYQFNNATTRNIGATLDLSNIAGKGGNKAGVLFPGQTFPNFILGGFATWALNDWVTTNLSAVAGVLATNYNLYQVSATPSAWGTASNISLTASTAANITTATINSLKISAAATATITAGNTLTVSSGGILIPNNATGAATITGGTLQGAASADLIVLENSSADSLTIASTIADNGGPTALTKSGMGTLILSGNNTYSGLTYINGATMAGGANVTPGINAAGTLQVGSGGTTGNLGNTTGITNYGTLAYDHSDNITLSFPLNGIGGLKQLGSGVLTLTGNNTYTGPTTISAGTLQVGAGAAAGSVGSTSAITNNANLVFDRPDAITINGAISGSGSVVNLGLGTTTLNNSNSYAGLTTISNGTVALGGAASIPLSSGIVLAAPGSTLDVSAVSGGLALSGGTIAQVLAGFGTVNGSVTATNNTTLTPGTNGVTGTLTINNNLTLAGGTLYLDVGTSAKDLVTVGGALNLNAGYIVVNTLNPLSNGTYKLIGYGSVSGALANVAFAGFSQAGQLAYLTNSATAKEIDLVVYNGAGAHLTWVGDGANNFWDITTSADWYNGAGASVFHNNDNVTFDDTSANPGVVLNAADSPASLVINTLVNNYAFTGSGSVVGGGSVIINATNTTVTITAPFNTSGQTIINTGTVLVGNGSTQGLLGIGVVTNNGSLNFNEPVDTTFGGSLAGSGSLFQQGSTMLALTGNNTAYNGPVTINAGVLDVGGASGSGSLGSGPVTNNGSLLVDRTGNLTLNNNITGSGPVAFVAGGTVTFGGNNTYANNTYISNGVVKLGSSAAMFSDGSAADWLILDGNANGAAGTLDLNGHNLAVNALSGLSSTANGLIENTGGSATNTLSIIGSATTTYSGNLQDNTGSGGKLALFVGGAANQTFDVESTTGNSYTGGTVISNATVTLRSSYAGSTANFPNPIGLGTGPVTLVSNAILYAVGGAGQNTGPIWTSLANTIYIPAGQTATIYGPQRGTMSANLTGGGTLNYITAYVRGNISGNWSAFTGQIILGDNANGGQLGIGNTAGFGHLFCTNSANVSPSVTIYNTVAGTPTIPIGELADDGTAYIESTSSGNAGGVAANFAVGGLNTSTNFGGGIIDNVGIIKVGTGTWTLTGSTLTYSGQTTVSNGVLALGASATLPNSTPITIAAPGTLDVSAAGTLTLAAQTLQGNGTLNGSLATGSGTTVSPGGANNIGTLTVTNDVSLSGTLLLELNRTNTAATNDLLVATTIEAGGTLQVNNLGPDLHTGDTFKLFSVPITSAFAVTNLPATTGNGSITYVWTNKLAIDGTIQVLVGVPNVNTNPATANFAATATGNTLQFAWAPDHEGWQLYTNSVGLSATNSWFPLSGSSSLTNQTITINPANPAVFFQLRYP